MTTLTLDELLAEVQAAHKGDEGLTTTEWAAVMCCSELTARRRIKRMMAAGRMERGKANRTSVMDGRTWPHFVFRVV